MAETNRGAQLLKAWRAARGLTQFELCKTLDIPPSQLSRYENGSTPSLKLANRIQSVTGGYIPTTAWERAAIPADLLKAEVA